jgi:hypothetical protein
MKNHNNKQPDFEKIFSDFQKENPIRQNEFQLLYEYGKTQFEREWLSPEEQQECLAYILKRTEKAKICTYKHFELYFSDFLRTKDLYDNFVNYLEQLIVIARNAKNPQPKLINPNSN